MLKSKLFSEKIYKKIEVQIKDYLNQQSKFLLPITTESPRSMGDAIEELLSDNFESIIGKEYQNFRTNFSRKAMAGLSFEDKDGLLYGVDVVTHRIDSDFNMPNLTSVDRLAKFYREKNCFFVILFVSYEVIKHNVKVNKVLFVPIEFFDWSCLTIGAIGKGQIQIKNSNLIQINDDCSRKDWMSNLCQYLLNDFYPFEIEKINQRIGYFERERRFWEDYTE